MFRRPVVVGSGVAGEAVERLLGKTILAVTTVTGHLRAVEILPVAVQAEVGQLLVIDVGKGKLGDDRFPSLVLHVAGLASPGRQATVQALGGDPLFGHIFVTILATRIGDAVDGGVAMATLVLKSSV